MTMSSTTTAITVTVTITTIIASAKGRPCLLSLIGRRDQDPK